MWLVGSLWHCWTLAFKVVTPIMHAVFNAAMPLGVKQFWRMWLQQKQLDGDKDAPECIAVVLAMSQSAVSQEHGVSGPTPGDTAFGPNWGT